MNCNLIASLALLCGAASYLAADGDVPQDRPSSQQTGRAADPLARRVSITISSRSLRETIPIIEELSGLRLIPLWRTDHQDGLDPDAPVALSITDQPVLALIERLIESADISGESTWQTTSSGAIQIGPKSRLNAFPRIIIYQVSDLIRTTPNHDRGPTLDLQQALQGQGAPIIDIEPASFESPAPRDRAEELARLIRSLVEPDQWRENGGDAAWIQVHGEALIIRAPGYIHRTLGGR